MTRVIGVRFRTAGKIYYFDPGNFEIKKGDHVIVETARGVEYGTVLSDPKDVEDNEVTKPLKAVLRMANEKDDEQEKSNRVREKEAFRICKEKIIKHGLEMKLIDAEYTFDNNKVLFYFTADGRIDFRDLVKDLASEFKTRIELRQIGVRDETKIIGGYGICGRPLCCHSYLSDFIPVSIKMAKEQNLSLNPTKISGVCGRLMCCLKNEEDVYEELNRKMPGIGDVVRTNEDQEGEVASVNILRQTVKILVDVDDEKEVHECNVDDLTLVRKKQKHRQNQQKEKDADEEAAKALEQQDKETASSDKGSSDKNNGNRKGGQGRGQNGSRGDNRNNGSDGSVKNQEAAANPGQKNPGPEASQNQATGNAGRNQEKAPDKNNEAASEKNSDRTSERNDRAPERNDRNGDKAPERNDRNGDKTPDKNNDRNNEKNSDRRNNRRRNFNKKGQNNRGNKGQDNRNQDNKNQGVRDNRDSGRDNRNQNRSEGTDGKQQS